MFRHDVYIHIKPSDHDLASVVIGAVELIHSLDHLRIIGYKAPLVAPSIAAVCVSTIRRHKVRLSFPDHTSSHG